MSHILKLTEWQSAAGHYYVSDLEELAKRSGYWYYIPIMLGISAEDYVLMLKNKYQSNSITYNKDKDVLIFTFPTLTLARKFKNDMNKIARDKSFRVCI